MLYYSGDLQSKTLFQLEISKLHVWRVISPDNAKLSPF